jgi:hypothetical protein
MYFSNLKIEIPNSIELLKTVHSHIQVPFLGHPFQLLLVSLFSF